MLLSDYDILLCLLYDVYDTQLFYTETIPCDTDSLSIPPFLLFPDVELGKMVESSDGSGTGLAVPVLLWRPKGGKNMTFFQRSGSGSTGLRYVSEAGSGSFYQQAK
jgi:hypothetical protein